MRHSIAFLVGGILWMGSWGAVAPAQIPREANERWAQLSPEQRERVKKNYDEWKSLSAERREEMERRHQELAALRRESASEGRDPAAVRNLLQQRRRDLIGGAGPSRDRLDELELADLEALAREKAADRLHKLMKRGVVDAAEVSRLLALEARELGKEMRRVNQVAFLREPPQRFLDLPDVERARLAALPPETFFRELHAVVPPPPRPEGARGWLDRFAPPVDAGHPPLFNPRFHFVKQWLDRNLSPAENARIRASDPIERRQIVIQLLLARARAESIARGLPPETIENLTHAPRIEREIELIRIIDPLASPPAPDSERIDANWRRFKSPRNNKPNR